MYVLKERNMNKLVVGLEFIVDSSITIPLVACVATSLSFSLSPPPPPCILRAYLTILQFLGQQWWYNNYSLDIGTKFGFSCLCHTKQDDFSAAFPLYCTSAHRFQNLEQHLLTGLENPFTNFNSRQKGLYSFSRCTMYFQALPFSLMHLITVFFPWYFNLALFGWQHHVWWHNCFCCMNIW